MQQVVSLYDYTGEAVKPWANAGYECFCYDIQHSYTPTRIKHGKGYINYIRMNLHHAPNFDDLWFKHRGYAAFLMAFPVCTDLAVSGAAHFERKRKADPAFQTKATQYAMMCGDLRERLDVPYFVENPVSVLATLWRKPDHKFHPYEYGGYIPEEQADHPRWPEYIAPSDAYPKKTCLWTGKGFEMPEVKPVDPEPGFSKQHLKLGGKSEKTKNIRSATPRGFAQAVFVANHVE